ncbi:MAG TPA: WD40 repeat domain-containing protein [Ktedonobacterales bacterium]
MKTLSHTSKNLWLLSAFGGLLLVLVFVLVACGGGQQASSTPTPNHGSNPGTTLLIYRGAHGSVSGVAWSPDGKYIASIGEEGSSVQIWDALTGQLHSTYTVQYAGAGVSLPAWSPDGKYLVTGGCDSVAKVLDAKTGKLLLAYHGHAVSEQDACIAVAWSPNGRYIASGGNDNVQVWDAMTGQLRAKYGNGGVMSLAWSPDSTYVASGGDAPTVQVWNALTGKLLLTYRGHSAHVIGVIWSPDGKYIASASSDYTVQVWDAMTGTRHLTYRAEANGGPASLAWSPNGKYIVVSEFRESTPEENKSDVEVIDAKTGKLILTYRGHSSLVWSLSWSPDGTRIASGSEDGTAQIWQAP